MTGREMPVTLTPGEYLVDLECPNCSGTQPVRIELGSRLTVDDDAGAQLRAKMRTKAADHICHQMALIAADPTLDAEQ